MKKKRGTLLLVLAFFAGLGLVLYPQLSNLWNRRTSSQAIASYTKTLDTIDEESYVEIWQAAKGFNEKIKKLPTYILPEELEEEYYRQLDVTGLGVMGYVEIPCLDVSLPIYHGEDDAVLQVATGHVDWSSLPTGGEGNHCIICGHRGLPSAKLFTDLPKMVVGDIFYIRVLDEVLTYEVDNIATVEPTDTTYLKKTDGMDYCTLLTCTPYGINSHRLLVRGHRVANTPEEKKTVLVTSEAAQIEPLLVAPVLALPLVLLLVLYALIRGRAQSRRKKTGFNGHDSFET